MVVLICNFVIRIRFLIEFKREIQCKYNRNLKSYHNIFLQRIPVDELITEDICKELEKRGFKKDENKSNKPSDYDEL